MVIRAPTKHETHRIQIEIRKQACEKHNGLKSQKSSITSNMIHARLKMEASTSLIIDLASK